MNSLLLLIICVAILVVGYIFYGGWLCKQWGVGESNKPTPAHEMEDGVDYVPAKAPVLMGHHFSSIAGAGPITGPIGAAMFGWVPVVLWILVGGIFFGGVHDFGALFASIRHKGQSIGEIISTNMSKRAKLLFTIFAYLTLILVVAAFASIVATTFGATVDEASGAIDVAASATNASVAMVSLLFIVIAIVFGFMVYRRNASMAVSTILGVVAIAACMAIGMNFHPIYLTTNTWMIIVGIYIAIASVTPVWILLQPRDYLSSFLLYAMLAVALVGVVISHAGMGGADGLAAFNGFAVDNGNGTQYLFPVLFTTVACGAISGFHSLVSSGTTSKQLDKETDARPIAYGGMLLECVLAVITVCAINFAYKNGITAGATAIFAGGISQMYGGVFGEGVVRVLNTLLVLTYSAFCLTSLDTATRLARFMFQEFFLEPGQTVDDVKEGWKKVAVNPYFATIITVILGIALGMTGYSKIWGLFGAANQLLAGIGLLAVATWLSNVGKNNKMFLLPMGFMIIVTICSLCVTVKNQVGMITAGGADWGPYAQAILA
ncbi:MAG: carbon starvation protein A, partial [Lachnospiraceae bacterium]|nr:carbon starvation protein A [Lachnospiraceae bacterium]